MIPEACGDAVEKRLEVAKSLKGASGRQGEGVFLNDC